MIPRKSVMMQCSNYQNCYSKILFLLLKTIKGPENFNLLGLYLLGLIDKIQILRENFKTSLQNKSIYYIFCVFIKHIFALVIVLTK